MPVSHLGLIVSDLPAATSFFLSTLQPLGYRYLGTQGDQIGFGFDKADFFLLPRASSSKPTPVHVAFAASDRLAVRDFYAAALTAGAHPAGAPCYRGDDNDVFNAAVYDLDGNTVEAIFSGSNTTSQYVPQDGNGKLLSWRVQSRVGSLYNEDLAMNARGRSSNYSKSEAASTVAPPASSRRARSVASAVKTAVSQMNDGQHGDPPSKTLIGTLIGAAAGAAVIYAMCRSEEESARQEAEYKGRSRRQRRPVLTSRSMSYSAHDYQPSQPMTVLQPMPDEYDLPQRTPPAMMSRHTLVVRRTYSTPALEPHASYQDMVSYSRRPSVPTIHETGEFPTPSSEVIRRCDSVTSTRSKPLTEAHLSKHERLYLKSASQSSDASQERSSATIQPSGRCFNTADTFHGSRAPSHHNIDRSSAYRRHSAAQIPLPPSRADTYYSAATSYKSSASTVRPTSRARRPSHVSKAHMPLPDSRATSSLSERFRDTADTDTVLPSDSISCVSLSSRRHRGRKTERRASEADVDYEKYRPAPRAERRAQEAAVGWDEYGSRDRGQKFRQSSVAERTAADDSRKGSIVTSPTRLRDRG